MLLMHSPIMTKSTMGNPATAPTVVLQPPPCKMVWANRLLYRCLTHPTNHSITILRVAMETDMAQLTANVNSSIGESSKAINLMEWKLKSISLIDNTRTVIDIIIHNSNSNNSIHNNSHRSLPMLIARTHYRAQWSSRTTKWPAITPKIDEIVVVRIPTEAIKTISIVNQQSARTEPMRQIFTSCQVKESTQERSSEFMLTTTKTQNNFTTC